MIDYWISFEEDKVILKWESEVDNSVGIRHQLTAQMLGWA